MERAKNYSPKTRWTEKELPEDIDKAIFYTVIRQQGVTSSQISFLLKSQICHSLPWHEIEEIYYQPDAGIYFFFRAGTVHIQGKNLEKLHHYLQQCKVTEIREFCDNPQLLFEESALFIEKITYESDNLKQRGLG